MLQQIQELQRENARLKNARSETPGATASAPPPKGARTPKGIATPKATNTPKASGTHPTPHSYRRPKDRHTATTEAPDTAIRSLEDCWNTRRMEEAGSDQEPEPVPGRSKGGRCHGCSSMLRKPWFLAIRCSGSGICGPLQAFDRTDQVPFLDEGKVTTTRWPLSMRGSLIALAKRRCLRPGQPVMNCQRL